MFILSIFFWGKYLSLKHREAETAIAEKFSILFYENKSVTDKNWILSSTFEQKIKNSSPEQSTIFFSPEFGSQIPGNVWVHLELLIEAYYAYASQRREKKTERKEQLHFTLFVGQRPPLVKNFDFALCEIKVEQFLSRTPHITQRLKVIT